MRNSDAAHDSRRIFAKIFAFFSLRRIETGCWRQYQGLVAVQKEANAMFPTHAAAEKHIAAADSAADRQAVSALAELSDAELLGRFFKDHLDAAFAAIVQRHGPLVYGVCRRILTDANDAEDAFQATFLVLVRKGGALRDPARLGSWLYGVAQRTARKARAKAALRTKSERQASSMATRSDVNDMTFPELKAVLDEEIAALPEKYALPLVLCYLEGKTNAQAAEQLGWPEGSMSRRLSKARELLRSRLAKRGLTLTAALLTSVLAGPAVRQVPAALLETTTRAALLAAEGIPLEDIVSPQAARLAQEVVQGMSAASRFSTPTIVVVASLLLIVTTAAWQLGAPAQAASLLHFRRSDSVHGRLSTTPTAAGATIIGSPAGSSSACGAATAACGSTGESGTTAACGSAAP
jgi:RNA polymerase sigma factor (sigma-70 family)